MQKSTTSRKPMPRTAEVTTDQMMAYGAITSARLVSSANSVGLESTQLIASDHFSGLMICHVIQK